MEAPLAQTVTTVLAARVKALRTKARLSGPALAVAMNEHGIPWNRTTVAKLETGRRESVTVQELFALALVLDVPPVWLLVDPEVGRAVPIAEGVEADPWTSLMWLTGWQPLEGSGEGAWAGAHNALYQLHTLAEALVTYRSIRRMTARPIVPAPLDQEDAAVEPGTHYVHGDLAEARRELDAIEAAQLRAIADRLGQFRALQLPVPPVPPDVRKRAAELDIELPGQEVTP